MTTKINRQRSVKNTYKKLQVNTTIHFYKVPHKNAGNLNRAKVLNVLQQVYKMKVEMYETGIIELAGW